jgi:hypothetical protein
MDNREAVLLNLSHPKDNIPQNATYNQLSIKIRLMNQLN